MPTAVCKHGWYFHRQSTINLKEGATTKKHISITSILLLVVLLATVFATPAFAITEAEVEAKVASEGKDAVTGSVLIWFLCAVGFLKVSQKIDSFMASLGVNVGHTGGSMLAEALIATRGIATVAGAAGHAIGGVGHRSSGGTSGTGSTSSPTGFFKGGLAGMVSRKVTNDAVKTASSTTSAVNTVKSAASKSTTNTVAQQHSAAKTESAVHATKESQASSASITKSTAQSSASSRTASTVHSAKASATKSTHTVSTATPVHRPSIGGVIFAKSLAAGGSFANDVIGTVARGDIRSTGTIKGELASQALSSYMGLTALGEQGKDIISFSDVEIGGGRITGIETVPGSSESIAFGMYQADQYTPPQGEYTTVHSADGTKWYKQYAQDAVERKPYMAPDNTVAYNESIVKKLPDPPKRKDRL